MNKPKIDREIMIGILVGGLVSLLVWSVLTAEPEITVYEVEPGIKCAAVKYLHHVSIDCWKEQ